MSAPANAPVLVVDDNDDIREALALILEYEGLAVESVADGDAALARMRREPQPCVVIFDLHMPGMDGWQLREAQQADPTLRDIPMIIYSGDSDVGQVAATMGLKGFFQKPTTIDRVLALVRRYAQCE